MGHTQSTSTKAKTVLILLALILFSISTIPRTLATTPGTLDTNFNGSGVATTNIGDTTSEQISALGIQSDGKIVAGGWVLSSGALKFALVRYTPSGLLDNAFGPNSNGTLTTLIGTDAVASALAIQSDGKIVLGGAASFSGVYRFALARYNINGLLDPTFGPNNNGTLTTPFGTSYAPINALSIQTDGKIVVAGSSYGRFAVARYSSNGALDPSFGPNANGTVTTNIGADARVYAIAIQSDGRLVLGGFTRNVAGIWVFALARYTTNGALDSTFGPNGNGTLTTLVGTASPYIFESINALGIQSDGRIVAAGGAPVGVVPYSLIGRLALARYSSSGMLDPTFGPNANGTMTTAMAAFSNGIALALQSNGKIVVGVQASISSPNLFGLARYTYTGLLDSTFGPHANGTLTTSIGQSATPYAMALQPDGNIVLGGSVATSTNALFAVARYIGDSTLPIIVSCGHGQSCSLQSNATISNVNFAGNTIHFTMTGTSGTIGCTNATIPKSAVPNINQLNIFVNGTKLAGSQLTIKQNSTFYFVYFCVTFHSSYVIAIVLPVGVGLSQYLPPIASLLTAPIVLRVRRRLPKKQ